MPAILLVDDEEVIRSLLRSQLMQEDCSVTTAGTRKDAIDHLDKTEFDLLIVDKNLPDGSGFDIIEALKRRGHRTEIIVITAYSDTHSAIQAINMGVFRYVPKPFNLKSLGMDVTKALETGRLRRDLDRRTRELESSNKALQESESRYKLLFNSSQDAVVVFSLDEDTMPQPFVEVNDVACRWLGYSRQEMLKRSVMNLYPTQKHDDMRMLLGQLLVNGHFLKEMEILRKDGQTVSMEVSGQLFELRNQQTVLGIARDITERRRGEQERAKLEEQLRQSQKMEAIGRLAGGVAHDMNNVLGAIMAYSSILEAEVDSLLQDDVTGILTACKKGRNLTRNLMGFARKGKYVKTAILLSDIASDVRNILVRTVPKSIKIVTQFDKNLATVEGDADQLSHAIMNICINSLDAMHGKGTLTIGVKNNEKVPPDIELEPGSHVLIEISDTGEGMDSKTMDRAFEPFFTRKEKGKGSGLGLSMVYGTVENHRGVINISSELNKGTTVRIYLPAMQKESKVSKEGDSSMILEKHHEGNVLLVDDEPMVRNAGQRLLQRLGYDVITAANGNEALDIYQKNAADIWLVVLDLIMPGMSGEDVFGALRDINPDVRVLLSSGYGKEHMADELLQKGANGFLQKPFNLQTLLGAMDEQSVQA